VIKLLARTLLALPVLLVAMTAAAVDGVNNQLISINSNDGTVLAGTLTFPANVKGKLPGLVLLQGSGPTDRDGNQPGIRSDVLRQIAEGLALKGIATLRYDKRGLPASAASVPADQAQYPAYFHWNRYVDDAYAAYAFLRAQPGIEMTKTGFLGHSEGGLIALDLTSRLVVTEQPAFLVLASTPGRRMDAVLQDQVGLKLTEQKASQAQRKFFLGENERIIKTIRDTGKVPDNVPTGLAALYPAYLGPFLQAWFKLDPAALAVKYAGPILLLQGDADIQVSPERDALVLDRALQRRSNDDHALVVVPRGSHNLKPLQNDKDPGFQGEIDPSVIERTASWLLSRLDR
jgi:uncharacterized protein